MKVIFDEGVGVTETYLSSINIDYNDKDKYLFSDSADNNAIFCSKLLANGTHIPTLNKNNSVAFDIYTV